jgi:hypothetical protein
MRRVVAMGGGGFSMEPENPLLDEFVLSLARTSRPRVCFLPTASGDSVDYVARFYRAFSALDCQPADLQLFQRTVLDLASFVLAQDVIYVGGGNTANLAAASGGADQAAGRGHGWRLRSEPSPGQAAPPAMIAAPRRSPQSRAPRAGVPRHAGTGSARHAGDPTGTKRLG